MSPAFFKASVAAILLAAVQTGAEAVEKVAGYDTFRLVRTRNMFDPNRRPVRTETPTTPRAATTAKQNRSSSLSLTGTMVTEGKVLAFFSGTRADYSKVLSVGGTIADRKITAIKAAEVELEHAGKRTALAVGRQLQIDGLASDVPAEETPVTVPASTAVAPPVPSPSEAPAGPTIPSATPPANATPATPTDKSEVLRRMMERRAKEMSK